MKLLTLGELLMLKLILELLDNLHLRLVKRGIPSIPKHKATKVMNNRQVAWRELNAGITALKRAYKRSV
jgi:hypothetical protein